MNRLLREKAYRAIDAAPEITSRREMRWQMRFINHYRSWPRWFAYAAAARRA